MSIGKEQYVGKDNVGRESLNRGVEQSVGQSTSVEKTFTD
jgi:hypothetical protein